MVFHRLMGEDGFVFVEKNAAQNVEITIFEESDVPREPADANRRDALIAELANAEHRIESLSTRGTQLMYYFFALLAASFVFWTTRVLPGLAESIGSSAWRSVYRDLLTSSVVVAFVGYVALKLFQIFFSMNERRRFAGRSRERLRDLLFGVSTLDRWAVRALPGDSRLKSSAQNAETTFSQEAVFLAVVRGSLAVLALFTLLALVCSVALVLTEGWPMLAFFWVGLSLAPPLVLHVAYHNASIGTMTTAAQEHVDRERALSEDEERRIAAALMEVSLPWK